MKKTIILLIFLVLQTSFCNSQSKKCDTILFENISLNNHHLFFRLKEIPNLEKYFGKIEKKINISNDEKILYNYCVSNYE